MSQEQYKQSVLDYFQALSHLDVEACIATFAEDGANHDPVGAPPNIGHAALRQYFSGISAGFSSLAIGAEEILWSGNHVAVKWQANGMGKNGRPVQFGGLDVFELNAAGKIKTVWGFWDPAPLFAALGAHG